ncbi:two-component system sensor histidine kinase PhoR [Psychromonas sp. MB-3u-54]|uniref:phosphate regulon sensor histidine kinase PhoR n=1 Tax=Psychromonas sp. MB-3u-54 TaxID=2058319 RepID=UPI000C34CE9F|nr:phosphate regulon sensor histidine kinase PhoR [Psychromonas sp. MB-3u-54]PKH01439.1 two-component system sensor histidine kinase PhoR [Psychromonas sp. MB-3u-54]
MKPFTTKHQIIALSVFYAPIIIFGVVFHCLKDLLLVSLFAHIVWHYYYLRKLNNWLWFDKSIILPKGKLDWQHAFNGLHNMQQRHRKRRNDLASIIRRFSEGSEALSDGVIVYAKSGGIVWSNRLAQFQLGFKRTDNSGFSRKEVSGEHITSLVPDPEFLAFLKRDDASELLELPSPIHPDKLLEFSVMPYAKHKRLLIVRDVTSYREMDEMRRRFVANVSHELRTPLTVLQGYIEILDMQLVDSPQQSKTLAILDQQTKRMCALVEQIMILSKIEGAGSIDLKTVVNVPFLLKQIESEALELGKNKSLTIKFEIDSNLHLLGDEMQLRSVMANLIYNAINYTPEHGSVNVRWRLSCKTGGHFSVVDDGEGIAEEHLHRLTERFYRVEGSRSRDTGGSGLGLSIVKHTLSHYGCELKVQSTIGAGSQFSFIIPTRYLIEK